ncbi:hypothetical protein IJL65_03745 [bacterium]|jgi:hypothetical protein|nr:hypothetical protein [bacterium]
MIQVTAIDINITTIPSSIDETGVHRISFLMDEYMIIPQETMIISHSITAAIPSIFQCQ